MDRRGAHTFPLIVIFGVFLAFLMTLVFVSIYSQQLYARVEDEASWLTEALSKTAFQSIVSSSLTFLDLPETLGGSEYSIEIVENSIFLLRITAGRGAGNVYVGRVNFSLVVENSEFELGGRIYFYSEGERVIVSSSEISAPKAPVFTTPSQAPPAFYYFSKENPKEAVGIAAVFFFGEKLENSDILKYAWRDGKLIVFGEAENRGFWRMVEFEENFTQVGKVEKAWIVGKIENISQMPADLLCPSIAGAFREGWVYSPSGALQHLRSRTWRRVLDNEIISVPGDAEIRAATVLTNVSIYPAWRVTFENQVIFYRMLPWWEKENDPGFLFQSAPELYPVI